MSISDEQKARILRLHLAEGWGVNTVADQLGIHHTTVERVLARAGLPRAERTRRPSKMDPWLPFMIETLERYPTLTAQRLYQMCVKRGYQGGSSLFRARVAELRPRPIPEAYLRLRTLPGEQAQVDWGHFGTVTIGRAERPLMAFVMVLAYSRRLFLRFYLNQRMEGFLHGHRSAFEYFAHVPRVLLYDNLKSAVLDRQGDAIRFHPTLLELSAHYHFEPRPVAPARGNEKGRVERAIRYVRDNFFAARTWRDLADLNAQAEQWCREVADQRRCPDDVERTNQAVFEQEEQAALLPLPQNPFDVSMRTEAKVGKTPYVRFDLNDYSVPHSAVRQSVTLISTLERIRVLLHGEAIAEHPRSYDKGQCIENPAHVEALVAWKAAARRGRAQQRLISAAPSAAEFLSAAASADYAPSAIAAQLEALLDRYGARELEVSLREVLQASTSRHPNTVALCLERRRDEQHRPPPLPLTLPQNDRARQIVVRPASLADYDRLADTNTDTDETNDGHD